MEIVSELAAVRRRMEEIAAGPGGPPAEFGTIVRLSSEIQHNRSGLGPNAVTPAAIDDLVRSNAAVARVDPALIEAIIANESGFDPDATSRAGARGLMQLMPDTAASLGVTDPNDPAQNLAGGTRYFRGLLDRFGDVELALAANTAGPAAAARYGGVPPYRETRNYVRNVLARYRELRSRE